jgi:hypothetical protein
MSDPLFLARMMSQHEHSEIMRALEKKNHRAEMAAADKYIHAKTAAALKEAEDRPNPIINLNVEKAKIDQAKAMKNLIDTVTAAAKEYGVQQQHIQTDLEQTIVKMSADKNNGQEQLEIKLSESDFTIVRLNGTIRNLENDLMQKDKAHELKEEKSSMKIFELVKRLREMGRDRAKLTKKAEEYKNTIREKDTKIEQLEQEIADLEKNNAQLEQQIMTKRSADQAQLDEENFSKKVKAEDNA